MGGLMVRAVVLMAAALAFTVNVGATSAPGDVRSLWSQLDTLWNGRDAQQFSDLFTAEASFGFVDRGESLDGRAAIYRSFSERFPRFPRELRHQTDVLEVRDIAPGVCTVDGRVEILRVAPGDDAEPEVLRAFAIFAVMLRTDAGWRIRELRAFQLPV
jgi:uncharacterized protein (TIGR02246 family)